MSASSIQVDSETSTDNYTVKWDATAGDKTKYVVHCLCMSSPGCQGSGPNEVLKNQSTIAVCGGLSPGSEFNTTVKVVKDGWTAQVSVAEHHAKTGILIPMYRCSIKGIGSH